MDLGDKLRLFLAEYGDRAYIVLRAVLDEAKSNRFKLRLGDVSARGVRERLKIQGVEYNPVPLLTKLEKEIGILETTYKSSSQHWWRVTDISVIEEVLREYTGEEQESSSLASIESPEARVVRLQLEVIGLRELARKISVMASKNKLTSSDWSLLRRIVLEDLPALIKIKESIEQNALTDVFQKELELIENIISTIESLISRVKNREAGRLQQTIAYMERFSEED